MLLEQITAVDEVNAVSKLSNPDIYYWLPATVQTFCLPYNLTSNMDIQQSPMILIALAFQTLSASYVASLIVLHDELS